MAIKSSKKGLQLSFLMNSQQSQPLEGNLGGGLNGELAGPLAKASPNSSRDHPPTAG